MKFLDKLDFDQLSGWSKADGQAGDMLLHFKPTIERLCERLEQIPTFRRAHRIRGSKEDVFWHIGSPQTDGFGKLEAYQYYQPYERHFYVRNHGGAGEIQFNIGAFGDGWEGASRSVRCAMGFSFGGRFIADKGSLGTVKTPFFFRSFRELMTSNSALRAEMERAITTQNLVYSRETELSGASRMVDAMIALDENHLPSDALTWVAFEHFVTWEKGQADLLDLDRFVSQHCAPVFEACYPIWEAVQRHTRLHYGDVI